MRREGQAHLGFRLRRVIVAVTAAGLIAGFAALDDAGRPLDLTVDEFHSPPLGRPQTLPAVPADEERSVSWVCAPGAGTAHVRSSLVLVTNTSSHRRTVRPTLVWDSGSRALPEFQLPARARLPVLGTEVPAASGRAVLVEIDGGGVVASQLVRGPAGVDLASCARPASGRLVLVTGSTIRTGRLSLVLANPSAEDSVVDAVVRADDVSRRPRTLQDLVVPARRTVVVELSDLVRLHRRVATTIDVRGGPVVVGRIQAFDGGPDGLSASHASAASSDRWYLPFGSARSGPSQRIVVFSAGEETLTTLSVSLDRNDEGGVPPFEVRVPPGGFGELDTDGPAWTDTVPEDVGYATTVTSEGPQVGVERIVVGRGGDGVAVSWAHPAAATKWVIPVSGIDSAEAEGVVVFNPSTTAFARLRMEGFGPDGERVLFDGELAPATRLALRVRGRASKWISLRASAPVAVDQVVYFSEPPDIALVPALPVSSAVREPVLGE